MAARMHLFFFFFCILHFNLRMYLSKLYSTRKCTQIMFGNLKRTNAAWKSQSVDTDYMKMNKLHCLVMKLVCLSFEMTVKIWLFFRGGRIQAFSIGGSANIFWRRNAAVPGCRRSQRPMSLQKIRGAALSLQN